jgi:hypothetical protein
MSKKSRNGQTLYYQQMYAASFVRPDCKMVIPVFPEMMTKQDGTSKNDCERNAAKRFYTRFRNEHPHLKVIVVEDALASNAPHVRDLQKLNLHYILGAKPGDHASLFAELAQAVKEERATQMSFIDPENRQTVHFFKFVNKVPREFQGSRVRPISREGGVEPAWSRDGRAVYYRDGDHLYRVAVQPEPQLDVGSPEPVFEDRFARAPTSVARANYDVHPDGQSFVMVDTSAAPPARLIVVQHWLGALDGGAPGR